MKTRPEGVKKTRREVKEVLRKGSRCGVVCLRRTVK